MSMIDLSVILISLFFALYGLASAVECGLVLRMLRQDKASKQQFTPLWEITNVLLVFGLTALAMLLKYCLKILCHDLIALFGVAAFIMLFRACLVLAIFYIKDGAYLSRKLVLPLALATFVVPLSFGASGIYLITGNMFWQTGLGFTCFVLELVSLISLGLLVVGRQRESLSFNLQILYLLWYLILGSVLPLAVSKSSADWQTWPISGLALMSLLGILIALLNDDKSRRFKTWHYGMVVFLLTPPALAWANRPYLISGKLSLAAAYGAQSYGSVVVYGLVATLPLVLVGLLLFIKFYGRAVEE